MNHVAIVLKQLREKADKVKGELAGIEAAIVALGGTVGSTAAPKGRRNRKAVATASTTTTTASRAPRVRNRAGNGADSPELIAALKAISERTDIHGIQKAQESRKVRAAFKRGDAVAPAHARPEGAVLGEAASAELS